MLDMKSSTFNCITCSSSVLGVYFLYMVFIVNAFLWGVKTYNVANFDQVYPSI